jgi:hypothetical protein
VVVYLGEAEVLVGQVAQSFQGGVDAGIAGGDGLKEGAQGVFVDAVTSLWSIAAI